MERSFPQVPFERGGKTPIAMQIAVPLTMFVIREMLVRLKIPTAWVKSESGDVVPIGQKVLIADDREYSLLEVREILIAPPATPAGRARSAWRSRRWRRSCGSSATCWAWRCR